MVKNIFRAGQSARAAHHRNSFPHTRRPFSRRGRVGNVKVHIVGDHQIEQTIAIVIDKGASGAPGFPGARDPGLFADFGEDSALIVIETILAVVGDVEVFPSVIVVVADANALSPARRGQTGLRGDVSKCSVMLVAVQMIGGSLSRGNPSRVVPFTRKMSGQPSLS